MAPRPSTTQRGYGWRHQKRRDRLIKLHRDGNECEYCGRPMYRNRERNFDGASLNADHEALDKANLANRLLHDTCNKKMNHADKWVKHGPDWYAKHRRSRAKATPREGADVLLGTQTVW